jgi:hypothetical protein
MSDPQVVAMLARLCEAERNACRICEHAAGLVTDDAVRTRVDQQARMHEAHGQALAAWIRALGGDAPRPHETREILAITVDDRGRPTSDLTARSALDEMRNELATEYEQVLSSPLLTAEQHAALQQMAPAAW